MADTAERSLTAPTSRDVHGQEASPSGVQGVMRQPPATPEYRYRAFISYSHRDAAWASWLHKRLEGYRVPARLVGTSTPSGVTPRRLTPIFRDRDELASATDLGEKVRQALAQSANLIVVCSPASAASAWVQQEVFAFKRLGRSGRIFCFIVEGEPGASSHPGLEEQECFGPALRYTLDAQGEPSDILAEPIAADARAGKDGRRNARLKLIAGLLDIDFDSLKRRELQRRHRRMTLITAAALVIAVVMASLAVLALHARHAADIARGDAERRQRQAEELVDFMLGDLNDKLHQVDRLDIIEDVDNKAMNYFASMPSTDVTDQNLTQRAKVLEKIGHMRQVQGHLPEAIAAYQAASNIAAWLAAKTPHDAARQLQWARMLAFIGQAHWYEGELDAAQAALDKARDVLQRAQPYAGNNLELVFELEMVDNNIGHVLEARGLLDEAVEPYTNALALSAKLVAAKPDHADWTSELGGAHNNLGKLALLRGDLAGAIAEYRADDAIETALAARQPEDVSQRNAMLTVRAILGRTLALAGEEAEGIRRMQQAVDMASELAASHQDNSGFQEDLARYAMQLARLRRLHGEPDAARALTARSLAIVATLSHDSPTDTGIQRMHAEALAEYAAELLASGNKAEAYAQARTALNLLTPLLAKQPHERSTVLATMTAQTLLAASTDDDAEATQRRQAVVEMAQTQPSGQGDPRLQSLRARALIGLGRGVDAQAIAKALWSNGYRDGEWLAAMRRARMDYPINAAFQKRLLAQNSNRPSS